MRVDDETQKAIEATRERRKQVALKGAQKKSGTSEKKSGEESDTSKSKG